MAQSAHVGRRSPPSQTGAILKRGFTRRCPVCGQGKLFRRWVQMVDRCPRCGYRFRRAPGQWLGSWFINVCLAQLVAVIFLIIAAGAAWPEPPNPWLLALGVIATAAWVFAFFPFSRTIWCAVDLAMKPLDFTDDVAPGFVLEADIAALHHERSQQSEQPEPAPDPDAI